MNCAVCGQRDLGCIAHDGHVYCRAPDPGEPAEFVFVGRTVDATVFERRDRSQDSIPAHRPLEVEPAGIESPAWVPVPLSELKGSPEVAWVWHGYAARGVTTLLVGVYKAGKSTLLAHLLAGMGSGGDLAGQVAAGKALIVSEEAALLWQRRRDDLKIGDHAELILRPFAARPTWDQWEAFVIHLERLVERRGYQVVVVDTLAAMLPLRDENDAAGMLRALAPLHGVTEAGAALLLIHHPRKSDAGEGQASRGSGALPGFVDIIVELRRFAPEDRDDRRRILTTYSRFDESAPETVIELTESGYCTVGSKADAKHQDRASVVRDLLPISQPGVTAEQIHERWPDGSVPRPGLRTLRIDLDKLDNISHVGTGVKGDPKRYYRVVATSAADSIPACLTPRDDPAGIEFS